MVPSGCVERLLRVRSDPPGAEVTVNGSPVHVVVSGERRPAVTPVDVPFDSYGTYEVTVRLPGHESESRLVPVRPPLYQYPPLDFFAENLYPFPLRDHHDVEFTLRPTAELDEGELAAFLERMRRVGARVDEPPAGATEPDGN